MRHFIQFMFVISLLLNLRVFAEDNDQSNTLKDDDSLRAEKATLKQNQNTKKKNLSSQIYEEEEKTDKKSFSGKVKLIREMGEIEVFFDGKEKGPFMLPDGPNLGLYKERLIKSQKSAQQKVKVKVEKENITSVELEEAPKTSTKQDVDSVVDSLLKK